MAFWSDDVGDGRGERWEGIEGREGEDGGGGAGKLGRWGRTEEEEGVESEANDEQQRTHLRAREDDGHPGGTAHIPTVHQAQQHYSTQRAKLHNSQHTTHATNGDNQTLTRGTLPQQLESTTREIPPPPWKSNEKKLRQNQKIRQNRRAPPMSPLQSIDIGKFEYYFDQQFVKHL